MSQHILFVSSWYPTQEKKSHGIFFKRHAEAAALLNDISSIHVQSGAKSEISTVTDNQVFTITGTYKKVNYQIPLISPIHKLWRSLQCFRKCYAALLRHKKKPDLVLLNVIFPAGIFVLWLHYLKRIPFIIQEQWSGYYPEDGNYRGFITKYITKKCVSFAKAIVVVSDKLEQSMRAHGLLNKYYRIGNVVDTNLFVPKPHADTQFFRFVHVSTVNDKEKNISGIIEAAYLLFQKNFSFRIDIIGDGPERHNFELLASQYHLLNKVVYFHGYQHPEAVAGFMADAHCFVLNSNYEGLPCVLLEAMSCGIPVISTSVGAVPEIVNFKQGILIQPNNSNELARAMEDMISCIAQYNGKEIRETIINNYSYPAIGKELDQIFRKVTTI